jgi:hypothetical protein
MRSHVFTAMLDSLPGKNGSSSSSTPEPIELPDDGAGLKLFFNALYSNNPFRLFTGTNTVTICDLAHKYDCPELLSASYNAAHRLARRSKLVGGPHPTIPELLLLSQTTQNLAIKHSILGKGLASFCKVLTPRRCLVHPHELLPCYHKTKACGGGDVLDGATRAVLCKLSPATLVDCLDSVLVDLKDKFVARPARLY